MCVLVRSCNVCVYESVRECVRWYGLAMCVFRRVCVSVCVGTVLQCVCLGECA